MKARGVFNRVRTRSGPGSPRGQPAWGGGCDGIKRSFWQDRIHLALNSFESPRGNLFRKHLRAGDARAFKQKSVERDARVNRERLVEFQMQMLPRRRVHIEFVNRAADCIQQMRPGFQRFRRDAAAARFRLARRTPVEQSHAHAAARETLSGERTGRARARD